MLGNAIDSTRASCKSCPWAGVVCSSRASPHFDSLAPNPSFTFKIYSEAHFRTRQYGF